MSDILLVHGSGYGGWCWDATIRALAAHGARARALDLPGRIFTPGLSLADHAAAILQEIRAPVTLVGIRRAVSPSPLRPRPQPPASSSG